jgi:hypothetical protein
MIDMSAKLRPEVLGERRELLEHRLHRRRGVVLREFEPLGPAAQVLLEEGHLVGVLEIGRGG